MDARFYALYCDDIRHEVGGKVSYMGVYSGVMLTQAMPIILNKICLMAHLSIQEDIEFELVHFKVYLGNELIGENEAHRPHGNFSVEIPKPESGKRYMSIKTHFEFSPFVVEQETYLKVRALVNGHEFKGGSLRIQRAPEGTDFPEV